MRAGEAARGGARIVWVAGEAGAGKTTLAEAAAQELAGEGWTVVWGRCPEVDGAPPAWAWTEVVQNLGGELPQAASAFWLARSAAQRLATAPGPLVVVFDDVHRADAATLQILRQVVAELAHHPVLVVLTYRASEAGEDLAVTSAVLAAATIDRMDVEGLDRGQVARLARESGLDLDDGQVAELTERTGGNPLFVREFVRLLAAEGPAAARHGVPAGVRDVLRRRLARLTGTARTVLRQAAVLGRESDVDVLAQVWGGDPDDLLDALEAAVLAGLLSEPAPNRVRFTHALVRDTLYADLPLLRRTRAHAAALAVLARRTPDDAAQLAHHALAAATPDTAATAMEYAVAAARQAAAMFAHVDAARLWAAAVAAHELSGRDDDARLVELLVPLVGAQASAGATSAARLTRDRAVELALRLGRRDLLIAALASWRTPVSWSIRYSMRTDDDDLVERTLRSVLAGPVPDDATRALLLVAEVFEAEDHDVPAAIEASGRALEAARRSGDTLALCAALNARCYVSLGPDLVDERDPTASELLDVATAAGLLGYQALAHFMLFLGALARTDLAGAQRHLDLALERSTTGQLGQILGVLAVFEATREVAAGHLDAAEHLYAAFSRRLEDQDAANGSEIGLIGRFVVGFARGDVSPLVDPLRALYDVVPGAMPEGLVLALLDAGRPDEARSVWDPSLAIARNYYWLGRTALRARAAARLSDTAEAAVLYGQLLPWAGRVAGLDSGSVTFGTVDASLAVLADALGWPAEADAHRAADARLRAAVRRQLAGLIRTSGVRDGGTTGSGRGA